MKRWREKKGVGSRTREGRRRSGGRTTDGEDRQAYGSAASGGRGASQNPPTGETVGRAYDLAFMALQRQRSSSGSVHSSTQGSMDPGTRWERRLRQGTSQTWSPSPGGLHSSRGGAPSTGHCVVGLEPELWEEQKERPRVPRKFKMVCEA